MAYFSGQGKVYAAPRGVGGAAGAFKFLGNVPELSVAMATSVIEHKESTSGSRITDQRIVKENKASCSMVLEEFNANNLVMALYGTTTAITGSTVTGEAFPSGLVAGDFVRTKFPKISAVTIKDGAGSPVTLVAGTDYAIESANHGLIRIISVGTYVQPFTINYTYAASTDVTMFSSAPAERYLRFEGLNTADGNNAVLVELYRVLFDPLKNFGMIQDDLAKFQLDGGVLYDTTRIADSQLGGFGRVMLLA